MFEIPDNLLELYMSDADVRHTIDRCRHDGIPFQTGLILLIRLLVDQRNTLSNELADLIARHRVIEIAKEESND